MTKFTLLGTGTSTGVPMIACQCRVCRSDDPRDKRLRVSVLVETPVATLVIDTSADFRQQLLGARVKRLDAVLYTHHHYDHIAGFDDLRAFQFLMHHAPTCYALQETYDHIRSTFPYAFGAKVQSGGGLPKIPFEVIGLEPFRTAGLDIIPIPLRHGGLNILGFRIGQFAYLTDCNDIPEFAYDRLRGLEVLVLDGLRPRPHPTHFSIEEAIGQASRIGAKMTYLTHMNHDVLHAEVERDLPAAVRLGYDGLSFTFD
jgi:phosphoribosyl 1,2-cyclic phosphate phosphodiesterase